MLAAWTVHDLEEVAILPGWLRTQLPRLREQFEQVPDPVWQRLHRVDTVQFAAAASVLGTVVAAAAVAGHRTAGRSSFYQAALTGFGAHGVVHLAQAAALGRYTPGSVTSAVVVLPYTLWARHRLRRAGLLQPTRWADVASGIGLTAAATAGAHVVAHRLLRVVRTRPSSRAKAAA